MNTCKKCSVQEEKGLLVPPGVVCTKCTEWYHMACFGKERLSRQGLKICQDCAKEDAINDALGQGQAAAVGFDPSHNSTLHDILEEDPRDAELAMLRDAVHQLRLQVSESAQMKRVISDEVEAAGGAAAFMSARNSSVFRAERAGIEVEALVSAPSQAPMYNAPMTSSMPVGSGMTPASVTSAVTFMTPHDGGNFGMIGQPIFNPMQSFVGHGPVPGVMSSTLAQNVGPSAQLMAGLHWSALPGQGQGFGCIPRQGNLRNVMPQQQHASAHPSHVNNAFGETLSGQSTQSATTWDRSLWRKRLPQEVLRRTQAPPLLTKDQIARRKTMNTVLPEFNGNPLRWLMFFTRYEETNNACGFTPSENMERIRAAVTQPALALVSHLLLQPDNVELVLGILHTSFGETQLIVEAMARKVDALAPLKSDLSNIALFAGKVDQLRMVNNMMDAAIPQLEIVRKLEKKLPLPYAEKWLVYKIERQHGASQTLMEMAMMPVVNGSLNDMADFLLMLYSHMANLGRHIPYIVDSDDESPAPAKPRYGSHKTVLMVQDATEPEEIRPAAPTRRGPRSGTTDNEATVSHVADVSGIRAAPANCTRSTGTKMCVFKCGNPKHKWSVCPEFKKMSLNSRWTWTRKQRRCFLCFDEHLQNACTSEAVCDVNDCGLRHHPLLHPADGVVHHVVNFNSAKFKRTLFRIAAVNVSVNNVDKQVLILMDSGSSVTLINTALADQMGLSGEPEIMALSWTDGNVQMEVETRKVAVEVNNPVSGDTFCLQARTYEDLELPSNRITTELLQREGLSHLPICVLNNEVPMILMGQDNTVMMRTISSIVGDSARVVASETPLGFVLEGERVETEAVCLVTNLQSDARMEKMLTKYIEEEHFGLQPDSSVVAESDEVLRARHIMETSTVQRDDGRYETALLWRKDDVKLQNNRQLAVQRFQHLQRKMDRSPELQTKIMELMASHVANGYARRAVDNICTPGRIYYLPVFNVTNPAKPDKLRLVYDAAAKYKDVSLNDELLSGPDLTVSLVTVLMRFRYHPIAISGDLKDMYHRVYVREEDRCAQRFVWPEGDQLVDYEMCVLPFGLTCSPALAQYAKNINAERYREASPEAVDAIVLDHYIDDWLGGSGSVSRLTELAQEVKRIHASGGFEMHKFLSNSPAVLQNLGVHSAQKEVQLSESAILGMTWNTDNDTMSLRFRKDKFDKELLDGSVPPSKREMLRVVMTIYDPLGLVSFITIEAKNILREAWREQAAWDDKLGGAIHRRWRDWALHLVELKDIVVPRFYGTADAPVELHVYVDASETAIAAVCYVVQRTGDKVIRMLVTSKCLVAPIKTKSIPRLELDAAVLGVRVLQMVKKTKMWNVNRIVLWTDAKDVMWWLLSSSRRYAPYVANRIAAILRETTIEQWRWTPTHLNPADWGTKGSGERENENLWWHGPDYLADDEDKWPECVRESPRSEHLLELRPLLMTTLQTMKVRKEVLIPDVTRFSRWLVFRNACAYAIKAIAIMQRKRCIGPITEADTVCAEEAIFRSVQVGMTEDKTIATFMATLAPFVDESGVLRMRGKAARQEHLPFDARFPIIVYGQHPAIQLLIQFYHHTNGHQNTTTVVNELRQRVTMPYMQAAVRKVITRCYTCIVRRAKPIVPQISALPLARMAIYMPAFSFMGIDYFGPYDVRIGRRTEKRWGALMTCLTTRAIYVEVVDSLSTEACLGVLDSVVTRRGLPLEIYSDNATCFIGAAKVYVTPRGFKPVWRFIAPRCPSMGGAWEREVGLTKTAFEDLSLPKVPKESQLRRGFIRCEGLVNCRPLTDIPCDAEEEDCLTPNHFLFGSSNGLKPKWKMTQWKPQESLERWDELVDAFWRKYVHLYLPKVSMRRCHQDKQMKLGEGDVVFICDDDYRAGWRRAIVSKVFLDKEADQVRQVEVTTADGKVYRRAAKMLAPIIRKTAV